MVLRAALWFQFNKWPAGIPAHAHTRTNWWFFLAFCLSERACLSHPVASISKHRKGWDDRLDDGDPAVRRLLKETEMQGGSGGYHDLQKGESLSCLCLAMRHHRLIPLQISVSQLTMSQMRTFSMNSCCFTTVFM